MNFIDRFMRCGEETMLIHDCRTFSGASFVRHRPADRTASRRFLDVLDG
jgi:hypothetical protein